MPLYGELDLTIADGKDWPEEQLSGVPARSFNAHSRAVRQEQLGRIMTFEVWSNETNPTRAHDSDCYVDRAPWPTVAAIVPARNAAATIDACLTALARQEPRPDAIIVFDDGSSDDTFAIASRHDVEIIRHSGAALGPAEGRNRVSATRTEDLLMFVDADVVVASTAMSHLQAAMRERGVVAAFGSYDDNPPSRRLSSIYANLRHHFMHQTARREAETFWSGLGIVRRDRFLAVGGFDSAMFRVPSIEDIELGGRLIAAGGRIVVAPKGQGTHLKDWDLLRLWHTDILRRALPWCKLIMAGRAASTVLNTSWGERAKALLAGSAVLTAALSPWWPPLLIATLAMLVAYCTLNWQFLALVKRRAGWRAALVSAVLHGCYHVYASATFVLVKAASIIGRGEAPRVDRSDAATLSPNVHP